MKLKIVSLLLFPLFLLSISCIYAQKDEIDLEMRDTVIQRGNLNLIPVYGKINVAGQKTMKIRVRFDAIVIDVKKAYGQANTAILDPEPAIETNLADLHNSYIDITSDNYKNIDSGVICYIEVEGLAAPDTVTQVKPEVVSLGDSLPVSKLINAKITVTGIPIFQTSNEGIENNYPNPILDQTTFKFRITNQTQINFRIYSPDGRKIYDLSDYSDNANIVITDDSNSIINDPKSHIFTKGTYTMVLSPVTWKFASGAYFMIMKTGSGAYKTNFLYTK